MKRGNPRFKRSLCLGLAAVSAILVQLVLLHPACLGDVTISTRTLTITGGAPPPPPAPFHPVFINTNKLTISGSGIPVPAAPAFPGVSVTTKTLTISGR